ncbi:MAG: SDR family oxidoreductase [Cyanobacteria bacterium Co-bin13]|nr:SDR family oxidoreductase [Cyanobacteria bacterium Co-bin13]
MKAFVTGSTGLLGSNLIRLLVQQGYTVRALVRSLPKGKALLGDLDGIEFVEGDLQDVPAFAPALRGCDTLFHAGAYFREYYGLGNHWPKLQRINVQGTLELLEAAEQAGIQKVIYVSSSGCIGRKPDGSPGDETTLPGPLSYSNLYFKSKVAAEDAIASFLQTHHLPVVLILPGGMVGPADTGPTELGKLVLDYLNRKLPALLDGGLPIVDVRDVAVGMLAAVERGQSGERYLIGGQYFPLITIMQTLETVSGIPAPKNKLPALLMRLLALLSTGIGILTGRKPDIPIEGVNFLLAKLAYDSTKAQRVLGIQFRPLDQTLKDTVSWYREQRFV